MNERCPGTEQPTEAKKTVVEERSHDCGKESKLWRLFVVFGSGAATLLRGEGGEFIVGV